MSTNVDDIIKKLSPAQRQQVESRAAGLIASHRFFSTTCRRPTDPAFVRTANFSTESRLFSVTCIFHGPVSRGRCCMLEPGKAFAAAKIGGEKPAKPDKLDGRNRISRLFAAKVSIKAGQI